MKFRLYLQKKFSEIISDVVVSNFIKLQLITKNGHIDTPAKI